MPNKSQFGPRFKGTGSLPSVRRKPFVQSKQIAYFPLKTSSIERAISVNLQYKMNLLFNTALKPRIMTLYEDGL